jgi:hemoglobin
MEYGNTTKPDISDRDDLAMLMRAFYERLLADDSIRFLFTDVAKIDLETHLPHLTDFWEAQLFGTGNYSGNPMNVHMQLHAKHALSSAHFDTWLVHFNRTVDDHFSGPKAHLMKERALSIATVMRIKIAQAHS